jgi:hypothetical protein
MRGNRSSKSIQLVLTFFFVHNVNQQHGGRAKSVFRFPIDGDD